MSDDDALAIRTQNPDLKTAWRTIAWWEQTASYWYERAHSAEAKSRLLAAMLTPPSSRLGGGSDD